jgi:hypothetical protein
MMTTRQWATALSFALGLTGPILAQEVDPRSSTRPLAQLLRPTTAAPTASTTGQAPPVVVPPLPSATPAASIQRPEPFAALGRPTTHDDPAAVPLAPVSYNAASSSTIYRAQAPDGTLSGPPPVAPPPATDSGLPPIVPSDGFNAGVDINRPVQKGFWDRCGEWFHGCSPSNTAGAHGFGSDHCFDWMISPLSNPFFFEDPRSLTEVRPLFFYQRFPSGTPGVSGGNAQFYGIQGRLALNENWDLVINKLGIVSINPHTTTPDFDGGTGFAEVWLGPKWTFYRCEQTATVVATGLTFQLPIGSRHEGQDTGTLGLYPYITAAQSFGGSSYGRFNFIGELGYSFSVDNARAEFFNLSLHLDYDVANWHHLYPLMELNWFYFTRSGNVAPLGFEAADLANFGSKGVAGQSLVTLALGLRYKFNEHVQTGAYFEFPLTGGRKDLDSYRIGFDVIFRY